MAPVSSGMLIVKAALAVLGAIVIAQTALSLVRSRAWWVRIFDFPRAQIAVASLVLLAIFGALNIGAEDARGWEWALFGALALAVAVQLGQMLPYTRLWKRHVPDAPRDVADERRLRIVISNVCMKNRDVARWLDVVRAERPHLLVAVEVDDWWHRQLQVLEAEYPHRVTQPQDNTYGVSVYSRLPLHGTKIEHLVEEDVPSIFTAVELEAGRRVRCAIVHPRPPRPDLQQDSALRDAELVRAAQIIREGSGPVIVAGDLNDVAWSHTTRLFQRIARTLDPRVGRGVFSTFHADHWYLRYPLDHVFHSNHFDLVELRRLPHVGSDHFPIAIELALRDETGGRPEIQPMDGDDREEAADAVEEAEEFRQSESAEKREDRKRADQ